MQEDVLQTKITGWTADYLVVCAFMAVGFQVLGSWVVPIIVESLIITVVTFIVCFYFGQRIGGSNDFERTLGLYGTSTGTVPSGIALVRIVDPEFKTSTAVELGLMNLVMLLSTPVYLVLLAMASGDLSTMIAMLILAGLCIVYLIVMKLTGTWGKKTFDWKNKEGGRRMDTIYYGGPILTMENQNDVPEAVLVKRGMIKKVGTLREVLDAADKKREEEEPEWKMSDAGFY